MLGRSLCSAAVIVLRIAAIIIVLFQATSQVRAQVAWWSQQPLVAAAVPDIDSDWVRNPVDAFVFRRLRATGLAPSAMADRRTLIRRLTFDLHGLPPTWAEVDAFVSDEAGDAYERLVDRLLQSPRYGERWARHWLDVVHYGETHGYDKDKLRPNAWPYRDYVIRSFQQDKPYARFVAEQIAGDILYPNTEDGIVALGFLAAGPWDFVGHVELRDGTVDKDITRSLDRDDMVHTTMSTFVSTTAACARCHDHKFDAIPQRDYYRLQAVFAGIDRADRSYQAATTDRHLTSSVGTLGYHSEIAALPDDRKWVQIDLGEARELDEILLYPAHEVFGGHPGPGFGFPVRFRIDVANDEACLDAVAIADHTDEDHQPPGDAPLHFAVGGKRARYVRITATRLFERTNDWIFALGELVVLASDRNVAALAPVTAHDSIEAGGAWGKAYLTDTAARRSGRMVYAAATEFAAAGNFTAAASPRPVHVLLRGDVRQPLAQVAAGALSCVPALEAHFDGSLDAAEGKRRAALAHWICDEANPLTWRSIVNRVWQYHFGRGLVDTPNDFGRMGSAPSHPELLDWLAVWFREHGGSFRQLHRLLLTSAAYRQSSAPRSQDDPAHRLDASNTLLWRMPRRRLEAEAIRDAMLAISGKLDLTMGGPSVRWFEFVDDHSPRYRYDAFDPDSAGAFRRSIYRHIVRSVPDPFFETLDCADASLLTPKRYATMSPLQALAMHNNRLVLRQAQHFAARVRNEANTVPGQVHAAVRIAFARAPLASERAIMIEHCEQHGLESLCRLIFNLNEFVFVD
jgi:cytochrome c553